MEKEKDNKPEEQISPLVKNILFIMRDEEDLLFANGQSKEKMTEILTETEDLFKTFLQDDNQEPFLKFIDSDPEIANFLTQERLCFQSGGQYGTSRNSVVSYMRQQLTKK